MLEQIMLYYGALCGLMTAIAMGLHAFGLADTKYGELVVKFANDFVGFYKVLRPTPAPPPPAEDKK
jgi:hypothetical protein